MEEAAVTGLVNVSGEGTIGQRPWPEQPGGGQYKAGFVPSQRVPDGKVGEEEKGERGRQQQREGDSGGASGCLMVQLNETFVMPLLVERLRVASPPKAQICKNSFIEAPRNWEFALMGIAHKS